MRGRPKQPLDRAARLLQFASDAMNMELVGITDELKRKQVLAAQQKVREAMADIRARQSS